MFEQFGQLWKMFIRPPRQEYSLSDLGNDLQMFGSYRARRIDMTVLNKKNEKLECSLFEPFQVSQRMASAYQSAADKYPCVIYCHCNSGSRLEALRILPNLISRGIALFCFDFAGSGLSEGQYVTLGINESIDLECVIAYLQDSSKISNIALWGRSMGAVTSIIYAGKRVKQRGVKAIVFDSGFSNLNFLVKNLAKQRTGMPNVLIEPALSLINDQVRERVQLDVQAIDLSKSIHNIYAPIYFVCSKEDSFVPCEHSEQLHARYNGQKWIKYVPGNHNEHRSNDVVDMLAEWVASHLLDSSHQPSSSLSSTQTLPTRNDSFNASSAQRLPSPPIIPRVNFVNTQSYQALPKGQILLLSHRNHQVQDRSVSPIKQLSSIKASSQQPFIGGSNSSNSNNQQIQTASINLQSIRNMISQQQHQQHTTSFAESQNSIEGGGGGGGCCFANEANNKFMSRSQSPVMQRYEMSSISTNISDKQSGDTGSSCFPSSELSSETISRKTSSTQTAAATAAAGGAVKAKASMSNITSSFLSDERIVNFCLTEETSQGVDDSSNLTQTSRSVRRTDSKIFSVQSVSSPFSISHMLKQSYDDSHLQAQQVQAGAHTEREDQQNIFISFNGNGTHNAGTVSRAFSPSQTTPTPTNCGSQIHLKQKRQHFGSVIPQIPSQLSSSPPPPAKTIRHFSTSSSRNHATATTTDAGFSVDTPEFKYKKSFFEKSPVVFHTDMSSTSQEFPNFNIVQQPAAATHRGFTSSYTSSRFQSESNASSNNITQVGATTATFSIQQQHQLMHQTPSNLRLRKQSTSQIPDQLQQQQSQQLISPSTELPTQQQSIWVPNVNSSRENPPTFTDDSNSNSIGNVRSQSQLQVTVKLPPKNPAASNPPQQKNQKQNGHSPSKSLSHIGQKFNGNFFINSPPSSFTSILDANEGDRTVSKCPSFVKQLSLQQHLLEEPSVQGQQHAQSHRNFSSFEFMLRAEQSQQQQQPQVTQVKDISKGFNQLSSINLTACSFVDNSISSSSSSTTMAAQTGGLVLRSCSSFNSNEQKLQIKTTPTPSYDQRSQQPQQLYSSPVKRSAVPVMEINIGQTVIPPLVKITNPFTANRSPVTPLPVNKLNIPLTKCKQQQQFRPMSSARCNEYQKTESITANQTATPLGDYSLGLMKHFSTQESTTATSSSQTARFTSSTSSTPLTSKPRLTVQVKQPRSPLPFQ